jgi:hypothetical protein
MTQTSPPAARRGAIIQEAVTAVLITVLLLAAMSQVLARIVHQHRLVRERAAARRVAGNLMEVAMARPWSQLAPADSGIAPDDLADLLPGASCHVDVASDDDSDTVRRIQIRIDWPASGGRTRPVRLVAWRFRPVEETP